MSAIFVHDDEQRRVAKTSLEARQKKLGRRIVTPLLPASAFTRAEDYHQKYRLRNRRDVMRVFDQLFSKADAFTDSTAATKVNGYLGGSLSRADLVRDLEAVENLPKGAAERILAVLP